METPFPEQVKQAIAQLFDKHRVKNPDFYQSLVAAIVHCFHIPAEGLSKEDKAKIILNQLFYDFTAHAGSKNPFQLISFIERYCEDKSFLIALLYGLYYGDIVLADFLHENVRDNFEYMMFQILAENADKGTIKPLILSLNLDSLVALISYLFRHYREGSFVLLNLLEMTLEEKPDAFPKPECLKQLIKGLRRKYFDADILFNLLMGKPEIVELDLQNILNLLEEDFQKKSKALHGILYRLIPGKPTFDEILEFVRLYGLKGHYPQLIVQNKTPAGNSLLEKAIVAENDLTHDRELTTQGTSEQAYIRAFLLAIEKHLEFLNQKASALKNALNRWTCAMPTKGRNLNNLPGLISVLRGLSAICQILNNKLKDEISLKDYPIFVFDQSEQTQFAKNGRYIDSLKRKYKCTIVHISQTDALAIAVKLGIEKFLDTSGDGFFGYGGARNCVFFLTPILRQAYTMGKKTLAEVLEMDERALIRLFQDHVLGKDAETIFMFDDDMEVCESNVLTHIVYSELSVSRYSVFQGRSIGRFTKFTDFMTLVSLLTTPKDNRLFLKWQINPWLSGMSEHTSKPKFCFNLPYGSEEGYGIGYYEDIPIVQPSYHLAGTRYPSSKIPTQPYVGVEKKLREYLYYSLEIRMMISLLDPLNQFNKCIFPWNAPSQYREFSCLEDAFTAVADEKNKNSMQVKFWKNVESTFQSASKIETNYETILQNFFTKEKLDPEESSSLKEIIRIYHTIQTETNYYWEYGFMVSDSIQSAFKDKNGLSSAHFSLKLKMLIDQSKEMMECKHRIHFSDFPLLLALHRVFHVVGAGEFNDLVKNLLERVGITEPRSIKSEEKDKDPNWTVWSKSP